MSDKYFPPYFAAKKETVSVKLNLNNYVTQKEFKNLTGNIDTSDFVFKTNVAEIKSKVDNIDVSKINSIDERQGKNYVEDSYLCFEPERRYLEKSSTVATNISSCKSMGLSDENIKFSAEIYSPILSLDGEKIYLTFNSNMLAQEKIVCSHWSIVNIYIVYTLFY